MKPGLSLPASVEERLSGWARIQEGRKRGAGEARPGPTITLSRKFGCEGFPLAVRLQERLTAATGAPWSVFDKALLEKVALDEGISMRLLSQLGNQGRALEAFGFHPWGKVTHDEAFAKVAEALVGIAAQGHAIIVGQGGAVLCRGMANAFHFRLEAGFPWRVASLVRRMGIPQEEAEELVKVHSRHRDAFIRERLGADVSDRSLYDAVFNNERHGVVAIAEAIVGYVLGAS